MWQGSQNLHATQKEYCTQNKKMTAVSYISDTEKIVIVSLSGSQHDGVAAFKLSERSPLRPAVSANNLPGGRTPILTNGQMRRIKHQRVESDEDSAPGNISGHKNWRDWNCILHHSNHCEEDWVAEFESDIEPNDNVDDPECPALRDVSAAQNIPSLNRPTGKSIRQAENVLMMVNSM